MGPLNPHAVAFHAGDLPVAEAEAEGGKAEAAGPKDAGASSQGKRSSGAGTVAHSKNAAAAVVAVLPAVLRLLADYLLDDDVAVISATQMALRCGCRV